MFGEAPSRFVQPQGLDKDGRSRAESFLEPTAEVARAEVCFAGESFHRQILAQVSAGPGNEVSKVVGRLYLEL